MTLLTRYVLKKFIGPFLAFLALLCIIIFVSQLLERLDRFLADGVSFSHVLGYLLTSMPIQIFQFLPVATFMATLFVVGNLARTREYIAGLAGGIPPEKFLGGLLWAGVLISFGALFANETVIPRLTEYSRIVYKEKIRRLGNWRQLQYQNLFVAGAQGRIWTAKVFNQELGRMERVIVDTYQSGKMGEQIDAVYAEREEEGWRFYDGLVRSFQTDGLSIKKIEKFDELFRPFEEETLDLVTQEPQPEEMNFKTLQRHIKRLSSLGVPVRKLKVELFMKFSFPVACFIVTLLGIPLAMKTRGSWGMGIVVSLALTLAYMGCMEFGRALAQRLIPPLIGAWAGNVIFFGIGLYFWLRMRRTA